MKVRVISSVAAAALGLASAGCASEPVASRAAKVSSAAWQDGTHHGPWPFTLNEGVLTCHAPDWVTFTANGTEYALSDNARWVGHFPDVSPVLGNGYVVIDNERQPVPITFEPLVTQGRELCGPPDPT